MSGSRHLYTLLGFAGLIPFVVPAALVALDSEWASLARQIGEVYAFGIISFLCGSWWGMGLEREKGKPLLLSNLYFLVALFIFVFAIQWWSLSAAILLMSLFLGENSSTLFPEISPRYRKMRAILTLVASLAMLTLHLAR
jgi:hypothetical protein